MGFHTEICDFHEKRILKIGLFDRVKELSKSERVFAKASFGKKVGFSYGNLRISRKKN